MSNYRRCREGSVWFFTVVTHRRRPILTTDLARLALRQAIEEIRKDRPFEMTAFVLLPDHVHAVWELPRGDADYSTRWRRIKSRFTTLWRESGGTCVGVTTSRSRRGEQGVWQRRFFEHTCRDDEDLRRCIDYLHVNPLKHGLVERGVDWPWSSFHRYVGLKEIPSEWGSAANWYGDEFAEFE